jgi:hypothetical protein
MATNSPSHAPTNIPTTLPTDLIIDLTSTSEPPTGHRLAELVQVLTGCSVERAEMAVSDPTPEGPASSEQALRTMALALVRLKSRQPAGLRPTTLA